MSVYAQSLSAFSKVHHTGVTFSQGFDQALANVGLKQRKNLNPVTSPRYNDSKIGHFLRVGTSFTIKLLYF